MRIGFSTVACPDWDLETVVSRGPEMGFEALELHGLERQMDLPLSAALTTDPGRVSGMCRDAGLPLVCLTMHERFAWWGPVGSSDTVARAREYIELAVSLDCPFVKLRPASLSNDQDRRQLLPSALAVLTDLASAALDAGVTLLLDNTGAVAASRDMWLVLDATAHPGVQVCWSPLRARAAGDTPSLAIPRLGRRIAMAAWTDARLSPVTLTPEACALPGEGHLELDYCHALLAGIGGPSLLIFEWPKLSTPSLSDPDQALPTAAGRMRAMIERFENTPELSAYKGDKNAPRLAVPQEQGPRAST